MPAPDSTWIEEADQLFPELMARIHADPDRKRNLDTALAFFPTTDDKIALVRYAHTIDLAPDDPAFFAMVRFMGMLVYLNEQRLKPPIQSITDKAADVSETLRQTTADLAKFVRVLLRQSEKTIDSATTTATALDELKKLIANLGETLDEATSKRLDLSLAKMHELIEDRASEVITTKAPALVEKAITEQTQALLEIFTETRDRAQQLAQVTVAMRDAIAPAVDAINGLDKTVPYLDRWIKIPARDARVGFTAALIAAIFGMAVGWNAHKPETYFTATPEVVQAMTAGADYLAIRDHLDPATKAKVDDAIRKFVAP